MSDLRQSQPERFPPGSFADGLGLQPSDHLPFAPNLRIASDRIFARHADGLGRPLGWEVYSPGRGGRMAVTYTAGMPKGLVAAQTPRGPSALLLVEGALAAIAVSVLARQGAVGTMSGLPLVPVAIGGFWNADVCSHVATLARRTGARHLLVGFSNHHAAGERMRRDAIDQLLTLGLPSMVFDAPEGGWLAGLLRARRHGEGLA